jgi:hypothetical protein
LATAKRQHPTLDVDLPAAMDEEYIERAQVVWIIGFFLYRISYSCMLCYHFASLQAANLLTLPLRQSKTKFEDFSGFKPAESEKSYREQERIKNFKEVTGYKFKK